MEGTQQNIPRGCSENVGQGDSKQYLVCKNHPSCPVTLSLAKPNIFDGDCLQIEPLNILQNTALEIKGERPGGEFNEKGILIENGHSSTMFTVQGRLTLRHIILKGGRGNSLQEV